MFGNCESMFLWKPIARITTVFFKFKERGGGKNESINLPDINLESIDDINEQ